MRINPRTLIISFFAQISMLAAQQVPTWQPFTYRHPYTTIDDLLNKDAQASDPAGIHLYSEDLAHLIVPDQAGANYTNSFADRLAKAEEAARERKRKLVPEAKVVKAFNELMRRIGAPPSIRTDTGRLHKFRAHAANIGALSAILTANRNGTDCYPGEAVYLLSVLLVTDGEISEDYLEQARASRRTAGQGGSATAVLSTEISMKALSFLAAYSTNYPRRGTIRLLNRVAKRFDF